MSDQSNIGAAAALLSETGIALREDVIPALDDALLALPDDEALVLEMTLYDGEDDASIASVLGIDEEEVDTLRNEARKHLLETSLGEQWGAESLQDILELTSRYWQRRRKQEIEKFGSALKESLDTSIADGVSLPESLHESLSRLWKRAMDEFDATAEQIIAAGRVAIQVSEGAVGRASSVEAEKQRRIERRFVIESPDGRTFRGLLVREFGNWRLVVEAHGEGLEGIRIPYEIVTGTDRVLHEGAVRLSEFEEGVYEGSEVIGRLDIDPDVEPEVGMIGLPPR